MMYVRTASKNPKNTRWWFHGEFFLIPDQRRYLYFPITSGKLQLIYFCNRCAVEKYNFVQLLMRVGFFALIILHCRGFFVETV